VSQSEQHSFSYTLFFALLLSTLCAGLLALVSQALDKPKELARTFDKSEQMLIAAKILTHNRHFLIKEGKQYLSAQYDSDGLLVAGERSATPKEIQSIYNKRIKPFLTDDHGNLHSFEEEHQDYHAYCELSKEGGCHLQPLKLLYAILPNPGSNQNAPIGYVSPIQGKGAWGPLYGFLALEPDGLTVIGVTWYEHQETPGLGANIAEEWWQKQFQGKKIFQCDAKGKTEPDCAPIGITVLKGKVSTLLGDSPKALSSVDGISGSSQTGRAVTATLHEVLEAYRPFFKNLQRAYET
jgi:Na+-transporting NADH:ubiquinone oxidoreductase subunit C